MGPPLRVEAVVDTGFTGALTLPASLITALSLSPVSSTRVMLADGSLVPANVYVGDVLWNGAPRRVRIHQAEGDILAGMSLMQGCLLTMEIVDGGRVTITPLP